MQNEIIIDSQIRERFNQLNMLKYNVQNLLDFYNCDQKHYMQNEWRQKVSPAQFDLIKDKIQIFPFTSQIVQELSIIFQNGLSYKNIDNSTNLIKLLNDTNLLSKLDYTNKMATLLSATAILIQINDESNINLQILTPDKYITQSDDFGKMTAFWYETGFKKYSLDSANKDLIYTRITKQFVQTVQLRGSKYVILNQVENILGFIPAVIFTQNLINQLQVNPKLNFLEMNVQLNNLLTNLNQLVFMQSFSTLVITNALQTSKPILYGINKVLMLSGQGTDVLGVNTQADAKFISPSARLSQVDLIISNRMQKYASSLGIGSSAYKNETLNSGYQLKLSKQDVINKAIKKLPIYQNKLNQLIDYITIIYNYINPRNKIIDQVTIQINEPSYDISMQQKEQLNKLRLQNKVTSPIRILMQQNQITLQQATELYMQIIQENKLDVAN